MSRNMTLFDRYSEGFAHPILPSLLDVNTILAMNVYDALYTLRSASYEATPEIDMTVNRELIHEARMMNEWLYVINECNDPSDSHEVCWMLGHAFDNPMDGYHGVADYCD